MGLGVASFELFQARKAIDRARAALCAAAPTEEIFSAWDSLRNAEREIDAADDWTDREIFRRAKAIPK